MISESIKQSTLRVCRTFRKLIGERTYQSLLRTGGTQWLLRAGGFTQEPSRRLSSFDIFQLHHREVEEALSIAIL
jgi:hypothetical protein